MKGGPVKNTGAFELSRKRREECEPVEPPPYVRGRDPYEGVRRTPENNFVEIGKRKKSEG